MRILLLFPLMLTPFMPAQNSQITTGDNPVVTIVSSKWLPTHRTFKKEVPNTAPPPEMTVGNKSAARAARVNNPLIPDPNEQTIDGRSAAIERNVQDARTPDPKPLIGFSYRARIHNPGMKTIEIVFWEYRFTDPSTKAVTRHQFLCGVKIRSNQEKDLEAFSLLGPSDVVNAASLSKQSLQEKALINRVEYSDDSIWQRRGWDFAEIKDNYKRAIQTPWESEGCRGL